MKIEITQQLDRANVTPDIAAQIITAYVPGASRIALLESEYNDVTNEAGNGITDELAAIAKTLLKKYAKERALLEKERKGLKEPYLNATKGIDGVARYIKKKCEEHEDALKQIVHHAEIVEQQRRAKLAEERIAKMSPYKANAHTLNLELMDDDAFEMMLAGACALYTQRKAEAEAAHAADEAARKAKREAEIADAAARLVAERDAATAAAAKTHTVHEESATPTLTDAELREIADNMQREITPDAGAVMLVSDAMKLIYEAYNIGFDDGSDACGGTPRYRTNEDVEAMKGERIIAHMNTIEHPAIVGYMQSENGSPTPNDVIIPKKEK